MLKSSSVNKRDLGAWMNPRVVSPGDGWLGWEEPEEGGWEMEEGEWSLTLETWMVMLELAFQLQGFGM